MTRCWVSRLYRYDSLSLCIYLGSPTTSPGRSCPREGLRVEKTRGERLALLAIVAAAVVD